MMPGFRWELYYDVALAPGAMFKHAQKTTDWIELVEGISKLFSNEEKFV